MAVNLSPRQLSSPDLAASSRRPQRQRPPAVSAVPGDHRERDHGGSGGRARALQSLKALGVRLAIDDFGVGYSSLSHLKYLLPVDLIKIDKSFVDGLTDGGDDRAIITAII